MLHGSTFTGHLQIIQWKQLTTKGLKPTEWGWTLHEGKYIPFATDIDIAPPDILKVSCCKCSADTIGDHVGLRHAFVVSMACIVFRLAKIAMVLRVKCQCHC